MPSMDSTGFARFVVCAILCGAFVGLTIYSALSHHLVRAGVYSAVAIVEAFMTIIVLRFETKRVS